VVFVLISLNGRLTTCLGATLTLPAVLGDFRLYLPVTMNLLREHLSAHVCKYLSRCNKSRVFRYSHHYLTEVAPARMFPEPQGTLKNIRADCVRSRDTRTRTRRRAHIDRCGSRKRSPQGSNLLKHWFHRAGSLESTNISSRATKSEG